MIGEGAPFYRSSAPPITAEHLLNLFTAREISARGAPFDDLPRP